MDNYYVTVRVFVEGAKDAESAYDVLHEALRSCALDNCIEDVKVEKADNEDES